MTADLLELLRLAELMALPFSYSANLSNIVKNLNIGKLQARLTEIHKIQLLEEKL